MAYLHHGDFITHIYSGRYPHSSCRCARETRAVITVFGRGVLCRYLARPRRLLAGGCRSGCGGSYAAGTTGCIVAPLGGVACFYLGVQCIHLRCRKSCRIGARRRFCWHFRRVAARCAGWYVWVRAARMHVCLVLCGSHPSYLMGELRRFVYHIRRSVDGCFCVADATSARHSRSRR